MTHRQLVEVAYKWILKNRSCGCAFKELHSLADNMEYPDVIGFGAGCHSVLVECKTSRRDFLHDKEKHFRRIPELGMGHQRFYCVPANLIHKEDLPAGWGLIWVDDKGTPRVKYNPYAGPLEGRHPGFSQNIRAEHGLMYSALRRVHLRGMIDTIYFPKPMQENLQNDR
jgi:hypothetical protein